MARLILSAGMFSALPAARGPRRRGLPSTSPPPAFAAMVISLIRRVKILPRLASSAPFLCLIVAHFEWPDMVRTSTLKFFVAAENPAERMKTQENTIIIARCARPPRGFAQPKHTFARPVPVLRYP